MGAKRFAELVKLFKEGKVDMQRDKNKYSDKEKKVLFNIEEIVEFSLREWICDIPHISFTNHLPYSPLPFGLDLF